MQTTGMAGIGPARPSRAALHAGTQAVPLSSPWLRGAAADDGATGARSTELLLAEATVEHSALVQKLDQTARPR